MQPNTIINAYFYMLHVQELGHHIDMAMVVSDYFRHRFLDLLILLISKVYLQK